jgi:putative transcriptional regulator
VIKTLILNRIKQLREQQNMSARDLAKKARVSKSTINNLENGLSVPSQITLLKISKALNKDARQVFMLDWRKVKL